MARTILVKKKGEWEVFFNSDTQAYNVFRNGIFFIGPKYCFREVASYVN